MHFGNPTALWLLALWPALAWLGWLSLRWRDRAAARLGSPDLVARLYPPTVRLWRRHRLLLALAATLLLTIAAARPQYGRIEKSIKSYGVNVLIGLDCSRSMLAEDVDPNRLDAARDSFAWLIRSLRGNRVGVMAFAGDAILNCPMTLDEEMALQILEALDTTTVGAPGTDLGRAIDTAAGAFERGAGQGARVLILITDGEDNEGKGLEAVKRAADLGIVLDAIGIGTETGSPLRADDGGFKEDAEGRMVNTRLSMDTLHAMAEATGGRAYAAGNAPRAAIDRVAAHIEQLEKAELQTRVRIIHQDRYAWFVAPALALLILMLLLRPAPPERVPLPAIPLKKAAPEKAGATDSTPSRA
jgi:Ca-activated chloride channel family protein